MTAIPGSASARVTLSHDGKTVAGDSANPLRVQLDVTGIGNATLAKEEDHAFAVAASTTADAAGGALSITAGDGAATNANGGALALDGGAKAGSGTGGAITVGGTNAESVTLSRTGKTTTVAGALAVTGATTLTGALTANGSVTLGDAAADVVTATGILRLLAALQITVADAGAAATSGTADAYAGTFTVASGSATYTLTNNKIASTSLLFACCVSGAVAQEVRSFIPGTGSAVLTLSGNAGANAKYAFIVITPAP